MDEGTTEDRYRRALEVAHREALAWLDDVADRPVRPELDVDGVLERLDHELQSGARDPADVVQELAAASAPGLMAMGSPRFFGFVIGGTYPAALAADWLVSAWDQNTGSRQPTPATAAVEEVAAGWLLDLLGLPPAAASGS
jgi:glutamate/tyrosine decarboxylase-like PLP-dependent enzyme